MASSTLLADLCELSDQLTTNSSVPTATASSPIARHFHALVTNASSPPLVWPHLVEALQTCFGTGAEIEVQAMEAGMYGLNLVACAFPKEEREGGMELEGVGATREKIEKSKWLIKLQDAAFRALTAFPREKRPRLTAPEPEKVLYKHIKEEETVFDHRKTSKGKGRESSVDEQPVAGPSGCAGYPAQFFSVAPEIQANPQANLEAIGLAVGSEVEFAAELEVAPELDSTIAAARRSEEEVQMEIEEPDYSVQMLLDQGFMDDDDDVDRQDGTDPLSTWVQEDDAPWRGQSIISESQSFYPSRDESNGDAASQALFVASPASTSHPSMSHRKHKQGKYPRHSLVLSLSPRPPSLHPLSSNVAQVAHALVALSSPATTPAISAQLKAWKLRLPTPTIAAVLKAQACFERVEEGRVVKEVWKKSALMGYPCAKGTNKGKLWCTCRRPSTDDHSIECADKHCTTKWFHLSCVSLTAFPPTPWTCLTCPSLPPPPPKPTNKRTQVHRLSHALLALPNERGTFAQLVAEVRRTEPEMGESGLKSCLGKNECFGREGEEWRIVEEWREMALKGVGSRKGKKEKRWCVCRLPESVEKGDMIKCSKHSRGCEVGWYHLECVGMAQDAEVEDRWTCEACSRR